MLRRNKLAMLVAEFLGTGILTLVLLSVQRSQLGLAYFVAIAVGLAVVALTFIFAGVSGAHFNPALTFALWTARRVRTPAALLYIGVQLLGAWAAYGLYKYFVNIDVQAVNQDFSGRIMVAEAIGAMIFAMAWAAAAYNRYDVGKAAAVSGFGLVIAVIVASAASIGLVNPALAVGARAWEVVGTQGLGNYVLGPVLGAIIGVNLYGLLFANPDAPFNFRRFSRAKTARVSTTSSVVDDDDLDEDEDETSVARKSTAKVAPRSSSVKVTKGKKTTTAKKVATKKKR